VAKVARKVVIPGVVGRSLARERVVGQVAELLKTERGALSRSRVARSMGMPTSQYSKLENGRNMTLHVLADVAAVYDSDVKITFVPKQRRRER
jgi:transcriptional regulator with XRE-family HTH domain